MSKPALTPVELQLRRVTRRLLVQTLLDRLAWCWAGALALAASWLLLRPLVLPAADAWWDWAAAGGLVLLATGLAAVLAFLGAPSRLAAALAMDERFQLRERVTTSLSLPAGQGESPAARALLDDVNRRVTGLDVRSGFPVRLSRSAVLVPLAAAALLAVVFFYEPGQGSASTSAADAGKRASADPKELQQKLDAIKKQLAKPWPKDQPKSAKLKELEKDLDKLLSQPLDPNDKDKIRERMKEMQPLEKRLKERMADLRGKADRAVQLKDALKDLKAADGNAQKRAGKAGPGKDLEKALARGDFRRAADEAERLRKKMQDGAMKPEERQQLEKEMRDLERQLKRLGDVQDVRDKLKEALDKGELAREQFDQQMQELDDLAGDRQDLQDLADALGECLQCLKKGDKLGAGKKLKRISAKLARLDADGKELKDLQDNENAMKEAQEALLLALRGRQAGDGKKGNGLGEGRLPGRSRPIAKGGPAEFKDGRQRVAEDEKGQRYISGFRKWGTFSKVPAREVGGTFRQAQQEAPAAIERQRVPPDAADILKGYFENLGGQK